MGLIHGTQQGHLETMLRYSDRLAQKIRTQRIQSGSLEFPSRETRILLNRQGRVKAIEPVVHDRAHQLIEEFMLLANEAVATRLSKLQRVTIHRTHERPDPARLREFRGSLHRHQIPCGNLKSRREIQRVMASLDRTPAGPALQIGFLRTLPRARYTTRPKGHFGLAKTHYAHFTSPIRRYADLLVHRSLFENSATRPHELHRVAEYLSVTEKNSSHAEKESKRSRLCDYLLYKLRSGDTSLYGALVTQICTFGILVEVSDLGVHGLVPRRLLKRHRYHLNFRQQQVRDRTTGRLITLGSPLRVTVSDVDKEKQQIEFTLSSPSRKPRKKSQQRP